jgi:hypothetical protein
MQAVIEMVHAQPFNRLGFLLIRRKGNAKRRVRLVGPAP